MRRNLLVLLAVMFAYSSCAKKDNMTYVREGRIAVGGLSCSAGYYINAAMLGLKWKNHFTVPIRYGRDQEYGLAIYFAPATELKLLSLDSPDHCELQVRLIDDGGQVLVNSVESFSVFEILSRMKTNDDCFLLCLNGGNKFVLKSHRTYYLSVSVLQESSVHFFYTCDLALLTAHGPQCHNPAT